MGIRRSAFSAGAGAAAAGTSRADQTLLALLEVSRTYRRGDETVKALDGVTLAVNAGEFHVITGPSGSGKSTLLHIMAGLDRPSSGEVLLQGQPLSAMHDDDLSTFRRRNIGFVFQFFHLLPALTAADNAALPMVLDGRRREETAEAAARALEMVGLTPRARHLPRQLSGGEQQRVAIARALIMQPRLILADEPTGNLDSSTGAEVMEVLRHASAATGAAVVLVTHHSGPARPGERVHTMHDGRLAEAP